MLRILNIRNLAPFNAEYHTIPVSVFEGFASEIMNAIDQGKESARHPQLNVIALGAPIYVNNAIGVHDPLKDPSDGFLQPHVYHVKYKHGTSSGPFRVLRTIARGVPVEHGCTRDHCIFKLYWMD